MKKLVALFLMATIAIVLAYPDDDMPDVQPRSLSYDVNYGAPMQQESLEGAESANPQWGRRWGGGGWRGGGWGGGYGNGGWGGGGGWGWGGRRGWGGWRG